MGGSLGSIVLCGALLGTAVNGQTTDNSGSREPEMLPPLAAPAGSAVTLYDQINNPAPVPGGVTSQDFELDFDSFDDQAADDFVVPAPGWVVEGVDVAGEYSSGGGGPAASFNVFFYSNSGGLPGAVVASRMAQSFSGGANASIPLSAPVSLFPGTYWVSVQARQDLITEGQWFWDNRAVTSNSPAAWRNPGGGFGTACTNFGVKTSCLPTQNGPDQLFRLNGHIREPSPLQVLIVYADTEGAPTPLQTATSAEPGVTAVDLFDATAGTPSLGQLQAYDVVVPMSNSPFLNATVLGDNLADYVDGGGKVVQFGFAFYGPGQPYGVNGRWASAGYSAFSYTTNLSFSAFTLGTHDAGNPLLAGVTALASDFQNVVTPAPGALGIATASNGNSLVAQRDLSANQTVGVTAYVGPAAISSGHFSKIIVNTGHLLFVDGFETGNRARWSISQP